MAKKKKKGKLKAGSPAAKAWGRKMKRLRAASGNPKKKRKKRKHNPYRYVASGEIPVTRKIRGRSSKFYSPQEMAELTRGYDATISDLNSRISHLKGMPLQDLLVAKELGELKAKKAEIARLRKAQSKEAKELARLRKSAEKADKFKDRIEKAGGSVDMAYSKNPKRKRKKKYAKKRKAGKRKKAAKKAAPRRRKGKKARKSRKSRKHYSSASVMKHAKTFRIGKGRRKRRVRVKSIVVVGGNPMISVDTLKAMAIPAAYAAGGLLVMNYILIPLVDKHIGSSLPGGSISGAVAQIPVVGQYVAPYAGTIAGIGLGMGVAWAAKKYGRGSEAAQIAQHAAIGAVGLGAALIALDLGKKYLLPPVSKAVGLGDVRFFPGMGSPDFGMYPQMGDGYRQQPGDFGIIPSGMKGVEFFPAKKGMGQVQFYPEGSDGDDMFRQSEAGDLMEAEGLGVIPAGMNGADFGEIPEGMSGDGQLG